jgi:cystathionine gamma-synthase/cystathionine gamma-lyase/cystathionine beta-lyase
MSTPRTRLETLLVHAGEEPRVDGAVTLPVFQSSTYESGDASSYHDLRYIRLNNTPNHRALHAKLAALEGTESALVFGSGMAALSTMMLTLLRPGDHLLAQPGLYGGTHELIVKDLAELGIKHDFFDPDDPAGWDRLVRPETRLVHCEAITNPLLRVIDLPALAAFAKRRGLLATIDATFATPVNFRPAAHGFDLVMHSATKYLNGHSDIVAGSVAGPAALVDAIRHKLNHLGGALDPHACFLLQRGLKTLALRVRAQNRSAQALAEHLAAHPAVARVHYPGLPSDPDHARARALFQGFGGMLSFELAGDAGAVDRFLAALRLPIVAPSLGGPETLVTLPARSSHSGLDPAARRALGIADGLVRVSVGLEAVEDLLEDFDHALRDARGTRNG